MRLDGETSRGRLNPQLVRHPPRFPSKYLLVLPGSQVLDNRIGKRNIKGLVLKGKVCSVTNYGRETFPSSVFIVKFVEQSHRKRLVKISLSLPCLRGAAYIKHTDIGRWANYVKEELHPFAAKSDEDVLAEFVEGELHVRPGLLSSFKSCDQGFPM